MVLSRLPVAMELSAADQATAEKRALVACSKTGRSPLGTSQIRSCEPPHEAILSPSGDQDAEVAPACASCATN
eukprot:scaffold2408_cov200-Pinguiococcus_pyrenoidosus.AAC.2